MATTRATLISNIRNLIGDLNASRYVIATNRLYRVIEMEYERLADLAGMGSFWLNTAFTTANGTQTYALSSSYQYMTIAGIVLNGAGGRVPLERVTVGEMVGLYKGTATVGEPTHYSLYEGTDQIVQVRLYPEPDAEAPQTADAFVMRFPLNLADDTSVIALSSVMIRALERAVASHCVDVISEEDAATMRVSRTVTGRWDKDVDQAIAQERIRLARFKRSGKLDQVEA
ncbi:MAG TPA: hypothetical protein VJ787_04705 [Thermoleophilia bacterium]|nr:hypothetical protein [Thermoleophilia bacterium]